MKQLHPGVKWLMRIWIYLSFLSLFVMLGIGLVWILIFFGKWKIIFPIFIIYMLVVVVFSEIYIRLAYKYWKYDFSENQLKIERGIILKIYKSIPYQRIQNVEIRRGLLARLLGFSSLEIHTAGYGGYSGKGRMVGAEGHIPAIENKKAEEIREFLIKKISKKSEK